jgi:hypothetical protein
VYQLRSFHTLPGCHCGARGGSKIGYFYKPALVFKARRKNIIPKPENIICKPSALLPIIIKPIPVTTEPAPVQNVLLFSILFFLSVAIFDTDYYKENKPK